MIEPATTDPVGQSLVRVTSAAVMGFEHSAHLLLVVFDSTELVLTVAVLVTTPVVETTLTLSTRVARSLPSTTPVAARVPTAQVTRSSLHASHHDSSNVLALQREKKAKTSSPKSLSNVMTTAVDKTLHPNGQRSSHIRAGFRRAPTPA